MGGRLPLSPQEWVPLPENFQMQASFFKQGFIVFLNACLWHFWCNN